MRITKPLESLGAALGVLAVLCTAATASYGWTTSIDKRLTSLEHNTTELRQAQIDYEQRTAASIAGVSKALTDIDQRNRESDTTLRIGINRVDDKLAALLIQGYQAQQGKVKAEQR